MIVHNDGCQEARDKPPAGVGEAGLPRADALGASTWSEQA